MKNRKFFGAARLTLTVCTVVLSFCACAQDYIDEDFLGNLDKNARVMLTEQAPAFKENKIPVRWHKESAVVLGYARSIQFDRQSRGGFLSRRERSLWFLEKDHFKIRLNDNNSVEAFSQVYFRYGAKEDGFIARIIKEDGSMKNVDLKTAVAVEDNHSVPEFFRSFFDQVANSDYKYFKVPIADLEPGDILEYVANTKSKLDVTSAGYIEFSPVYEVCSKQYPVMYNSIAIETDDKSYFKYQSLNGAPKFVKENTADNEYFRYVFEDRNRDTEKDVNFVSPLLNYPLVKFQVIYSNSDKAKGALIGEKGELKNQFSKEELARKAWENYEMVGDAPYTRGATVQDFINACWSELQKLGAKSWTEKQYIERAYYLVRNKIVFRDTYLSDKVFAYVFGSLLYQRDIKSELVITIGNDIGTLKEVLFDDEIRYVIKVGDTLYFNATDYSNPGDLQESLLNNDAYIIYEPAKKGGAQEIKPFTLPGTTAADNLTDVAFKTQLSADLRDLLVIRTTSYKGIPKANSIAKELKFTTYMLDDYKNYGGDPPTEKMKSREQDEYNNSVRALRDEFKKRKPEFVKESLESEYGQPLKEVHYDLLSDGRTLKKPVLSVKEGFVLTSYSRKAGKKLLLNLPGLIGDQLQIKKAERVRTHDIDIRYPKTFSWKIEFQIPEGYKAEGLNEINKSIDNEAGSFSVVANEENGALLINISKVYKEKKIAKEKWTDLLAVLDSAYNTSFKYIALVPTK